MKTDTLLLLSDSQLTVYSYSSHIISLDKVYDLNAAESLAGFSSWLQEDPSRPLSLLLDVSCEDYYEELLPHVRGRDRGLLLARKVSKHFPVEGYAHTTHSSRLTTGRRDDIYFISGIADPALLDPVVDILADNDVAIRGVYSLPQLTAELIKPVEHSEKVLVVSCDEDLANRGRYIFRQTFIVEGKLYFSRKTSVAADNGLEMAESVRKEIERTWQYLNNRRVLEADKRMQVLMVLASQVSSFLKGEPEASHCQYIYADVAELAVQHAYASDSTELSSGSLAAFILGQSGGRKSHYQPKRLGFIRRHQQVRLLLNVACVVIVVLTGFFAAVNLLQGINIKAANETLLIKSHSLATMLKTQEDDFQYQGPEPQKMQARVALSERILGRSAAPDFVYSVISDSFSSFDDLMLTSLKWRNSGYEQQGRRANRNNKNTSVDSTAVASQVLVKLAGEFTAFDGDFRRSIERIQELIARLEADERIVAVDVKRLPLDIDPSLKISRTLSDQRIPSFAIDVTLNLAMM